MKKRVCVTITSRASFARCRTVLTSIQAHDNLELQTVVAASALIDRYGDIRGAMLDAGITVDAESHCLIAGENPGSMARTTGLLVQDLTEIFQRLKPDCVVVIADRHETIAVSIAARYLNIPLAHIQGGERTGSIDNSVRFANTMFANYHFVATEGAKSCLINYGQDPATIFETGCPAMDIARIAKDWEFPKLEGGVGADVTFTPGEYLLCVFHPDTQEYGGDLDHGASAEAERQMNEVLLALKEIGLPTIGLWPNPDAGSDGISKAIRKFNENGNKTVRWFKNFSPDDYIVLLANAKCCIGNSSSFIREGSFLGTPALIIGNRQQKRELATNACYPTQQLTESMFTILRRLAVYGGVRKSDLYGDGHSGPRIADILSELDFDHRK